MILQTACHRWRFVQRHVLAWEIEKRESQRQGCFVILSLLVECVGQSRESSGRHTQSMVAVFNMAGAGTVLNWITDYRLVRDS